MHVASARSFGLVAAIASVVTLVGASACSTRSADVPAGDPPQLASAGAPQSNVDRSPDAAAAPIEDAGKRTYALVRAGTPAEDDAGVAVAPFHIIGRFDTRDPAGPSFGWSATEIRARFSGESLSVILKDTGLSYYDVTVDGAAPTTLLVTGAARPYEIATGLAPGEHDVILTKKTETITGVTQLLGFVGTLVPTPVPSGRRIELVGDSITCGYGVLGLNETCAFSASTESEPLAWGAIAARQLAALHMVTAVSGLGVIRNYAGDTADTMPERYDRALANDPSSTWDHHAFEPDVIVVELGTNDFEGGKGDPGPGFEVTYTAFLATLRARHPQARIVAATSPMLRNDDRTRLASYLADAVAARQSAGDAKVSWFEIAQQNGSDGYGCDYHPNVTTQKEMAATLVSHLKPLMGW